MIPRLRNLTNEPKETSSYSDEAMQQYLDDANGNVYRAASVIWEEKAAKAADQYGFSADGATLNRDQMYQHASRMASRMRALATGFRSIRLRSVEGANDG